MKRTELKRKTPLRAKKPMRQRRPVRVASMDDGPLPPRKTEQEIGHMGRVATLPCCISDQKCKGRITVHHLVGVKYKGMGQKASDFETIPLCEAHHQDGGPGVALHAGVQTWEQNYGTQEYHLQVTRLVLAQTSPDYCVLTGERLRTPKDQISLILDTPDGGE